MAGFDLMGLFANMGGAAGGAAGAGTGFGDPSKYLQAAKMFGSMGGAAQDPMIMAGPQLPGNGVTPAAAVRANLGNQGAQMQVSAARAAAEKKAQTQRMLESMGTLANQFKQEPTYPDPYGGEQHPPVMETQPGAPGWPPQEGAGLLGGAGVQPVNQMPLGPLGAGPAPQPATVDRRYLAPAGGAPQSSLRDILPDLANQVSLAESDGVHYGKDGLPKRNRKSGAIGLMQIRPETAADPGFGLDPISRDILDTPGGNREFGTAYLGKMLDRYDNVTDALAAYNWGPGKVDDWLADGGRWNALPKATQDYINNIQRTMGNSIA